MLNCNFKLKFGSFYSKIPYSYNEVRFTVRKYQALKRDIGKLRQGVIVTSHAVYLNKWKIFISLDLKLIRTQCDKYNACYGNYQAIKARPN